MSGNVHDPVWTEEGPAPRFGVLARHFRLSRLLSQRILADAAGLSSSTVRGWEAGRSEPSMPELMRWSRALDLSEAMTAAVRATLRAPRAWADRPGIGIGPYLRERRLASGLTLTLAARELRLPLATLGHYESGRVEVPPTALAAIVERFGAGVVERAALCDGPTAFLEWCDALVERPDRAYAAVARAAYAATPAEIIDRGPAFVRLRTGLLRARLRGSSWDPCTDFAASAHALWLATGERRTEAAVALAGIATPAAELESSYAVVAAITRRYLGRTRTGELEALADATANPARAAWLRSEAALDHCEHRHGSEARALVERAKAEADETGLWSESWMRRRDAARVHMRLRNWNGARAELAAMARLEPSALREDGWYARQREALHRRLDAENVTARPVGP